MPQPSAIEKPISTSLWKNASFLYIWLANLCTNLTFSIYVLVESWYVVHALKMENELGLILFATVFPRVLFSLLGGMLADQLPKTQILLYSNFLRSLLLFSIAILLYFNLMPFWLLILFAFGLGTLDAFYLPTNTSIIPMIVDRANLTKANAYIQLANQCSLFVGPFIGGLLLAWTDFSVTFFLLSFLLLCGTGLISKVKLEEDNRKKSTKQQHPFKELKQSYFLVKHHSFLLILMLTGTILNFFLSGPISNSLPLFVEQTLHSEAIDLSYLESSITLGMLLGSLILSRKKKMPKRKTIFLYLILFCCLVILMGITDSLQAWIIILLIGGIFLVMIQTSLITFIQEITPQQQLGKVFGFFSTVSLAFLPLSNLTMTLLLQIGIAFDHILMACGIISFLYCLLILQNKHLQEPDEKRGEQLEENRKHPINEAVDGSAKSQDFATN